MSRCNKAKHPCKICLGNVSMRNGLQCQGACHGWVHFNCLNYTPGKINDIKKGLIKVTCPCPDCKTILPKEYRTTQPFTCSNQRCPANSPPKCENQKCPINADESRALSKQSCPLGECGKSCKKHSTLQAPYVNLPPCPVKPCTRPPPKCKPPSTPLKSETCFIAPSCNSACSSMSIPPILEVPDDCCNPPPTEPCNTMEEMCTTIGLLANQLTQLMDRMNAVPNENQYDASGNVLRGYKPGTHPSQILLSPFPTPQPPNDSNCCCRRTSKRNRP